MTAGDSFLDRSAHIDDSCRMLETVLTVLPYPADARRWFAGLRALPYPLLFDSAQADGSRYDILCADPTAVLSFRDGITCVETATSRQTYRELPMQQIRRLLAEQQHLAADIDPTLPFSGGLAGFFAYEFGHTLERMPRPAHGEAPLPDVLLGLYQWAVVIDHDRQRSTLATPFPMTAAERQAIVDLLDSGGSVIQSPFHLQGRFRSSLERAAYGQAFGKIQQYIRAGDCYQVNLSQRFSSRFDGDAWQAFCQLSAGLHSPYSAYFQGPDWTIMSVSPEAFLRCRQGRVETSPIKGTIPRGLTAAADRKQRQLLHDSPKDRAENLMIVDLLRNDLGRNCQPGSIQVDRLWAVESYPNVHHLVSTVSGTLRGDRDVLDLLCGCFPGGSITGAPKIRAMQIIDELEPQPRSVYCGSMAYLGLDGSLDCSIAIRTVLCENGRIHGWAGGGIVADSEEEAEYQECQAKIGRILEILEQFPAISIATP